MAKNDNSSGDSRTEFRGEIDRLAAEAREAANKHRDNIPQSKMNEGKRAISPVIWAGLFLVGVEALLLAAQLAIPRQNLAEEPSQMHREILVEKSCRGEIFRTHSKIVAYTREKGQPPKALVDLVGDKYVPAVPMDPETKKPLVYTTDGQGFALTCPRPDRIA